MSSFPSNKRKYFDWLLSPWTILAGMSSGVAIGILNKPLARAIAPGGVLFLALLQMCVLPIMIAAVSSSLAKLLRSKEVSKYLSRIIYVFLFGLLFASGVGMALGEIGQPGKRLDQQSREILGKMLADSESGTVDDEAAEYIPDSFVSITEPLKKSKSAPKLQEFLTGIVPINIFLALSQGENLKILFFSIVFGVALGAVSSKSADRIIQGISVIFKAFEKVIGWIMYILPFGLCSLLADQISRVGLSMMKAMVHFVGIIYVGVFIFILLNGILIWLAAKTTFFHAFIALKKPLMISFGTHSSFAAMPAALEAMSKELHLERETINLVIPLGITLCRFATVMTFALSTVFFAQLYEVSLGTADLVIILVGSVFAALASAGAPGVVALGMLSMIFNPLNLPVDAAITLLLAIDPVIDPVLTLVNVHTNCAATALIAQKQTTSALTEKVYE